MMVVTAAIILLMALALSLVSERRVRSRIAQMQDRLARIAGGQLALDVRCSSLRRDVDQLRKHTLPIRQRAVAVGSYVLHQELGCLVLEPLGERQLEDFDDASRPVVSWWIDEGSDPPTLRFLRGSPR